MKKHVVKKPVRRVAKKDVGPSFVCECCGETTHKIRDHHILYRPEIKANICYACHVWMHGNGMVYNHKVKRDAATYHGVNARGVAPYIFALRVLDLYARKVPPATDTTLAAGERIRDSEIIH